MKERKKHGINMKMLSKESWYSTSKVISRTVIDHTIRVKYIEYIIKK